MHYGSTAEGLARSAWRAVPGTGRQYFTCHNFTEHIKTRSALCALRFALIIDALD